MRITILALGSRGDVQPFVALGGGLERAGHRVTIAAAADYRALVEDYGLRFAPLVGAIRELADPEAIQASLGVIGLPRYFFREVPPLIERLVADAWRASADADALIATTLGAFCAFHLCERRHIPCIIAHMHPNQATGSAPQMFFPRAPAWLPGRGRYHRLSYRLHDLAFWQCLRPAFNRARRTTLGLAGLGPVQLMRQVGRWRAPILCGYSAAVAPPPDDWATSDHLSGYWFLPPPAGWQPPEDLAAFLAAGAPPVYISFGSMMLGMREGQRLTALLVEALGRCGRRGIIGRGWGDLGGVALPASVIAVDAIPHDWLFPQVAAVVHHGGAGVTAAALRAGVPAACVPFLGDQGFWGRQIARLGAGITLPRHSQLTAAGLAAAIDVVTQQSTYRVQAQRVAEQLAQENGIERAVAWIERTLAPQAVQPHSDACLGL